MARTVDRAGPEDERDATGRSEPADPPGSDGGDATAAETPPELPDDDGKNRWRAALFTAPFLALGLLNVVLVFAWGLQPLWVFAMLPPILFVTVLTYIAFRTGFAEDRSDVPGS